MEERPTTMPDPDHRASKEKEEKQSPTDVFGIFADNSYEDQAGGVEDGQRVLEEPLFVPDLESACEEDFEIDEENDVENDKENDFHMSIEDVVVWVENKSIQDVIVWEDVDVFPQFSDAARVEELLYNPEDDSDDDSMCVHIPHIPLVSKTSEKEEEKKSLGVQIIICQDRDDKGQERKGGRSMTKSFRHSLKGLKERFGIK